MNVKDTKYRTNKVIQLKLKDVGTAKQQVKQQVKIKRRKIIFMITQVGLYILKLSVFLCI